MAIEQTFARDGNSVPITGLGLIATKAITYVAGTTGAVGATTLFTVIGSVVVRVWAIESDTDITGTGTIEVGVSGNTAAILAQTAGTQIDVGEIWVDTGPSTVEGLPAMQILNGTNIIQTIASSTLDAGTLTFYCAWFPLSNNSSVT